MSYRKLVGYIFVLMLLCFGAFVFFYGKHTAYSQQKQMARHAEVIKEDVWTLNFEGASGYLELASSRDNYDLITVEGIPTGKLFTVAGPPLSGLDSVLDRIGVLPVTAMETNVNYNGQVIARLTAQHRNMNIYVYLYAFLVFSLIYVVISLFSKLVYAKHRIEETVRERTVELRESEGVLRGTFNSTADGILVVDEQKKVISSNDRFAEMWGIPKSLIAKGIDRTLVEHSLDKLKGPEDFKAGITELYSGHEEKLEEINLKDGRVFERFSCPLVLGKEQIGRVWNFRDITNRKRAEKERENLLRTLKSKNDELQSIVFIASHDLKSPLVNIQGFSTMLNESCKEIIEILKEYDLSDEVMQRISSLTDEDIPESLKFISASTVKMKELLDGLLQVSRVGTIEIKIKPLDMDSIIENVLQGMEFQFKEKGIEVTIDKLPDCIGDANQINQIFSNLVSNAIKYLDPEREGKIHISGEIDNLQCIYCVEDNGMGIHPSHQKKVFQLFHRLNPDDAVRGEGLGLTIVTRILDRNNGSIWVESEPSKGSKFFVSLPRS